MTGPDDSLNEPIPGSPSRPGAPVPSNARLSTGEGLTTTIRLITSPFDFDNMMSPPKLQPMQPSFDLIMSPGPTGHRQPIWPASPSNNRQSLYPALPLDDLPSLNAIVASAAASPAKFIRPTNPTQDVFSPSKPSAPPSTKKGPAGRLSLPQNQPFLFGSPLPQPRLSNKDFGTAAASVLDEMNKRLAEAGVQKVDAGILNKDGSSGDVFGSTAIPTLPKPTGERFAQAHDDVFSKMDSIANHYAARRPAASKKRKSDALGHGPAPSAKRKSTVAGHTGQRVISNGVRKNMTLPGGFGDEDFTDVEDANDNEEEDAGDRRASKRIRVVENQDITKGKRVSLLPTQPGQTEEDRERVDRRKSRDRDAMKKRLDANKARRRSSRGRQSIGKVPPRTFSTIIISFKPKDINVALNPIAKASRFGFLSSAKNLVRNVWNMGAGGSKPNNAASNIPKPSTLTKQPPPTKPPVSKPPFTTGVGLGHPISKPNAQTARVRSTSSTSTTSHLQAKTAALGSARTRSPIPSFAAPTGEKRAISGGQSSIVSKRGSVVPRKVSGGVGHMRKDSNSSVGSRAISPIVPKRPSGHSTLLAPTASSLAKMKAAVHPGTSNTTTTTSPRTLQSILNTPLKSPRPTKIFSRPLGDLGSPTTMPTPNKNNSLGAVANALMGTTKPALPPKPQSLAARRPRVSRTRVIAKLGAQRAAAAASSSQTSSAPSVLKSPTSGRKRDSAGGRTRSSMGSSRRSLGVVKNGGTRVPSGGEVMMSAKKKARQSEYMRRRSGVRAARVSLAVAGTGAASKRISLGNTPLKNAFTGVSVGTGAMDTGDD